MSRSSSSTSSDATGNAFAERMDLNAIRDLALRTRQAQLRQHEPFFDAHPHYLEAITCAVLTPPKTGAYNAVFELQFSDNVSWAMRIPMDECWGPTDSRAMQLDIIAMEFIVSHTSVPIPALHAYSCDGNNALGRPYMIMDKVRGTCLFDVWNDPSWWTGTRRKENLFQSLAEYMTELASFEFNKIGRLDRGEPDGPYTIAPFPSGRGLLGAEGPDEAFGPFTSTHVYLTALLALRRSTNTDDSKRPMHALLGLLAGALPDAQFDGAPFTLGHPDFDAQNIFIDDTGRVVGLIDWDGVAVMPRQLGALKYPAWLTIDWNPVIYDYHLEQPGRDTAEDLHSYREMYADAVRVASGGRLDAVTRNSHIVATVHDAITSVGYMEALVLQLGEYVFGSERTTCEVLEGVEHGGWYMSNPHEIAVVGRMGLGRRYLRSA